MKKVFSKEIEYINIMGNNVLDLKYSETEDFLNEFKLKPGETAIDTIIVGEPGGRTLGAMNTGIGEMSTSKKGIDFDNPLIQPGFPAKTISDALPDLEKKYDRILILIGSQSGNKATVCNEAQQIDNYLGNNSNEKIRMLFVTSNPDSIPGKIVKRHNGVILNLKGKGDNIDPNNYKKAGFLGDLFETGAAVGLQTVTEVVHKNGEVGDFYTTAEEHLKKIGSTIDEKINSKFFEKITDDMVTRSYAFLGGYAGLARTVSETACVRDNQFKMLVGGKAFVMGESSTPSTMPGDIGIWTSLSGGKGKVYTESGEGNPSYVVDWCKILQSRGGRSYSIVGTPNTPLEACTPKDNVLLLKEEAKPGEPARFYTDAFLVHGVIPNKAIEKAEKLGIIKYSADKMREGHHIG
jgi:hypothetical protein